MGWAERANRRSQAKKAGMLPPKPAKELNWWRRKKIEALEDKIRKSRNAFQPQPDQLP